MKDRGRPRALRISFGPRAKERVLLPCRDQHGRPVVEILEVSARGARHAVVSFGATWLPGPRFWRKAGPAMRRAHCAMARMRRGPGFCHEEPLDLGHVSGGVPLRALQSVSIQDRPGRLPLARYAGRRADGRLVRYSTDVETVPPPTVTWAESAPLTLDSLAELRRKLVASQPRSESIVVSPIFATTLRRWNSRRKRAKR